ncbi:hypothetical protein [Methylocystis sp. MJC1]|jgi:hypothetical protein|uniref:hypothetical protein n=1 Tax=Methylocystis sp. MJC1 TaxID=2654282 RepID=UPI0013ED8564|nr:hypothetical protein [Methylocystis sp. MJC1]
MRRIILVGGISLSLAGCAGVSPAPESELVAVPSIIGSLKCAFAKALVSEREPGRIERLKDRIAKVTLDLKVVDDQKTSFGLKGKATAGGPFVFALGSGVASISPSFSTSVQITDTIDTTITLHYLLKADNAKRLFGKSAREGFAVA